MKRKILIYRGGGGGIMWPPNYRPQACYCYVVLLTFGGMIPNLTLPLYQGNTDRPVHQGLHHYNWRPFSVLLQNRFLALVLPNLNRSGQNFAHIYCCKKYTSGPTETAICLWTASGQTRTSMISVIIPNPKSCIKTTDRRDFGSKPSKWRWGRVLSLKNPEFCSVGGARSKKSIFRFVYLRLSCAQPTRNSFPPEQWYQWKASTLSLWKCALNGEPVTSRLAYIDPWSVPNWKLALHTHVKKFDDSRNAFVSICDEK